MEQSIVDAVGKWLGGPKEIRYFQLIRHFKGSVNTVLRLNMKRKHMPGHPIALREGMQIRNFMRNLPECKDWSQDDLNKGWIEVIDTLIDQQKANGNT